MYHPGAGGAEIVLWQLSRRLVDEGHAVTLLTSSYGAALSREHVDGIDIIRIGRNRYLHSAQALMHYARQLRDKHDTVIEVVNTAPYFSAFFGKKSKRYLLYHQLAREVWFHETRAPLSYFGNYLLEPTATRILGRTGVPAIAMSESTRQDLLRYGFKPELTHTISEGIEIDPAADITRLKKFKRPTLLGLGTLRAMKRTLVQIEAFEIAKRTMPALQLKLAGSSEGSYGKRVLARIDASPYAADIEYLGHISKEDKIKLMQKSHALLYTSIREGWGLVVTEAASQGTPAVVYDVPGLRDSVRHSSTGIIVPPTADSLAEGILILLHDPKRYEVIRQAAWEWSKLITFDQSYKDFKGVIEL